jgi:hypothetical protein
MPDVFISYSRKDSAFVRQLHDALAKLNRDVWVDWEDIPLTADWWQEISGGIESADTFVLVVSPNSLSSPVCALEIAHATQHQKRLVPIVRDEVDEKAVFAALAAHTPDDNLRKTLNGRDLLTVARDNWQAIARHNWLFFKEDAEFDSNFAKLMTAVDTDLDYVRQHTRLLVQGREWEGHSRDDSYLLTGAEIRDAETFLAQSVNKQPRPTDLHGEYILASQQAETNRRQHDQKLQRQARRRLRLFIGLLIVGVVVILGVFTWFTSLTSNTSYEFAEQYLHTLVEVAARNIDGDEFEALVNQAERNDEGLTDDPRYWEQAQWLYEVKSADPGIREVYTYIPGGEGEVQFVVSSLALDENAPIPAPEFLEPYMTRGLALFIGLEETHVLPDVVTDENGVWYSGFTPILNARGEHVGALGIDIRYDAFLKTPSLLLGILQVLVALVVIALVVGGVVVAVMRRRQRRVAVAV